MKKTQKIIGTLLATIMCLGLPGQTLKSIFATDTGNCSINVTFKDNKVEENNEIKDVLIDGATFAVAKVASEKSGKYEWIDKVEQNDTFAYLTEDMFDEKKSLDVAEELSKMSKELEFTYAKTDSTAKCSFDGLDEGIYLLLETNREGTALKYSLAMPSLISVPEWKDGVLNYSVDVSPKTTVITEKTTTVSGKKSWENDSDEVRPKSITLRLYSNGVEISKVTTSQKEGWAYTFEQINSLDAKGNPVKLSIKEDYVDGYDFEQDKPKEGENTVIINVTNTYDDSDTGVDAPKSPWLPIAGCSALGILVLGVLLVKQKKKDKKSD